MARYLARLLVLFCLSVFATTAFAASDPNAIWSGSFYPPGVDGDVRAACTYRGRLVLGGSFRFVGDQPIEGLAWRTNSGWQSVPGELTGYVLDLVSTRGSLLAAGLLEAGPSHVACPVAVLRGKVWTPLLTDAEPPRVGAKLLAAGGDVYIAIESQSPLFSRPVSVFRWNGATVDPLPMSPLIFLSDMEWHDNRLFAAGLDEDNQAKVVAWNGTGWEEFPKMEDNPEGLPLEGVQLAEFQGNLLAALNASRFPRSRVLLRWDGDGWVDLGARFFDFERPRPGYVSDVIEFQDRLIVSGSFNWVGDLPSYGLAAWNGSDWEDLARDRNATYWPSVAHLAEVKMGLIVMGHYFSIGDIHAHHVALWDGTTWQQVVEGGLGMAGFAQAFTLYQGNLIAGGVFTHAGGVAASNVARWTDQGWAPLGEGLPAYRPGEGQFVPGVHAFAVYEGDLIAAGQLSSDVFPSDVARWDGATWRPMGHLRAFLKSLAVYQGELYVGGEFCLPGQDCLIARWNGQEWEPTGAGLDSSVTYAGVNAMLSLEGQDSPELILGGWFRSQNARGIASWAGSPLMPLGYGFTGGGVSTLARYQGSIIAAGSLDGTRADGTTLPVHALARWTGSVWQNLDMHGNVDGWPMALAEDGEDLYVGGDIRSVGHGMNVSNIARWDGTWSAMGSGVDRQVEAMQQVNGLLFVGGKFATAGNRPSQGIAVWGNPAVRRPLLKPISIAENSVLISTAGGFRVSFTLSRSQDIQLNVYDIAGRLVNRIASGNLAEGPHTISWDGHAMTGAEVPAGIYFLRLRGTDVTRVWRAVKKR